MATIRNSDLDLANTQKCPRFLCRFSTVSQPHPLIGGYDYEFIDPGPSDDQKCPICFLVVKEAQQATCCGKLFCKTCLQRVQQSNPSCPHCRQNFNGKYFPDIRGDREIKNLKVLCKYKKRRCKWSGELRDVEKHMEECSYKEIECLKCRSKMMKLLMDKHITQECVFRECKCSLCDMKGTYKSITSKNHQSVCPAVEVDCPNHGCLEHMKRQDLSAHRSICLKEKVECPFASFGCDFNDCRESLSEHIETEFQSHMKMVAEGTEQLSVRIETTLDKLEVASSQMNGVLRIAPLVLKLTDYTKLKEANKQWFSDGFYTGPGGYRMRLIVFPNGNSHGGSTHVSVFINLLPGKYDDMVEFPIQGNATVTLLNQLNDNSHHDTSIKFNGTEEFHSRKLAVNATGTGSPKFIKHHLLQQANINYLQNDSLYFRVNVHIESNTKPWLT